MSQSGSDSVPHSENDATKKKTRAVTFSLVNGENPPSPSASDASSSQRNKTARAQRSARRQLKVETEPPKKGPATVTKKGSKRRMEMKKDLGVLTTTSTKKNADGKEEEVVKIKLNTGTLYLYKGANRRAVFVRRL
jgi:hypothetical protein